MRVHCFVCHRAVYLQRLHRRPCDAVRRSSAEQSREPQELSEETTLNHVRPPTATRKITGYQGASLRGEWHVSWFLVPVVASSKQTENYLMSFEDQHFFWDTWSIVQVQRLKNSPQQQAQFIGKSWITSLTKLYQRYQISSAGSLHLNYSHYCSHGICLLVHIEVGIEVQYLHPVSVQQNWKETSRYPLSTQTVCASWQRKVRGAQGWHLAGVSQHILQHTHTNALFLTLWIRVLQEPWGVLWSLLPCHLAAQRSLSIGI